MKKFSLIAILLVVVLFLQNCKKDVISASTLSNTTLFASINDTTWTADTVNAAITYNSATKTKVFTCTGIAVNKEINILVTQNNAGNTAGFPLGTYNVDATSNVAFSYYTMQKNSSGNLVFAPQGTVNPGSGSITISAIDSVKKQITGTFSFISLKDNYDSMGNILSVNLATVSAGAFNSLPYTFKSN
jgi:hypothetical protein